MNAAPDPFICFSGIAPTIGDTAIGQSILRGLKANTGLPLRVRSNRPEIFGALPDLDEGDVVLPALPPVPAPALRTPALPLRLRRLLRDLRTTGGRRTLPPPVHAALVETLNGCAAVVYQGGPNWNDRMLDRRKALERWLFLEAARAWGCRLYHVGVSCGPFAWRYPERLWMAPLCRRALSRYDILFVRDAFSQPALQRLGVRAPVVESTDAAVFLDSRPDAAFADVERRIGQRSGRLKVVVCVRDFQPAYPHAREVRDRTVRALAHVLDRVQRHLADVYFLSTDHNPQALKRTDLEVARDIQQLMRTRGSTVIDVDVRVPSALKHIYGRFDAMVSMRLHPTILALDHGVPCLLLSYDAKCDDFFTRLGLADDAVPLAAFSPERALERLARMLQDRELRSRIASRYAALKQRHAGDYAPMYAGILERAREMTRGRPAARHAPGIGRAVATMER